MFSLRSLIVATIAAGTYAQTAPGGKHATCGGNANGAPCQFPFKYNGTVYTSCTKTEDAIEEWCSTSTAVPLRWGNCNCGVPLSKCDETLRGVNGAGYRGCQDHTRSGKTCQAWTSQSPQRHKNTPGTRPNGGLTANYCRNPDGHTSLWCYTTDPNTRWEECDPKSATVPIGPASSAAGSASAPADSTYRETAASNGSWVLIFRQTVCESCGWLDKDHKGDDCDSCDWFSKDEWSRNPSDPSAPMFARLDTIEAYRSRSGFLRFKMTWPGQVVSMNATGIYPKTPDPEGNEWEQISNPLTNPQGGVAGYTPLNVKHAGNHFRGLEHSGGRVNGRGQRALLDGSIDHVDWYFAIGAFKPWGAARLIPAWHPSVGGPNPESYVARTVELRIWHESAPPGCDSKCGCGYTAITDDLDGEGQVVSYPGLGIRKCALACNTRPRCTSFEYTFGSALDYKCATYTAGASNYRPADPAVGGLWQSCVKDGEAAGSLGGGNGGNTVLSVLLGLISVSLLIAVVILFLKNMRLQRQQTVSATELGAAQNSGGTLRTPSPGGSLLDNLRSRMHREPSGGHQALPTTTNGLLESDAADNE